MLRQIIVVCIFLFLSSCSIHEGNSEVCFVGDSIFAIWDVEASFPDYVIHKHAVVGAKLENIDEWDLMECRGVPTVLLIGTNNIGKSYLDSANTFLSQKKYTESLLNRVEILDASPLLYVSILPRKANDGADTMINAYIESLNSLVKETLDSSKVDYLYINSYSAFLDQGYRLNEHLFKDGLHPNAEGYEVLRARIGSFL